VRNESERVFKKRNQTIKTVKELLKKMSRGLGKREGRSIEILSNERIFDQELSISEKKHNKCGGGKEGVGGD